MISLKRNANALKDKNIREIWKKKLYTDLKISCDGVIVGVHKALLASASTYMTRLLAEVQNIDDCIVILDGYRSKEVENLTRLLYEGEIFVSEKEIVYLKELMGALKIEKIAAAVGYDPEVAAVSDPVIDGGINEEGSEIVHSFIDGMENGSEHECSFFDDQSMSYVEISDQQTDTNEKVILTNQLDEVEVNEEECEEHLEEIGDIVIKTSRRSRPSKNTCQRCQLESPTIESLVVHALTHTDEEKSSNEDVQCTLCLEIFPTAEQCALHTKVFHEEVTCHICNVVLSAKRMKGHMKQEHDMVEGHDGKVTYCCLCKKTFTKAQYQAHYARMHLKTKEPRDSEPIQCPYCNKNFSATHLNYHIRLNHSSRPVFNCNQCKKIFKTKESRDEHKEFCFKATTVCNFCNEMYRPVYRKVHLMRHAREECANIPPNTQGLYNCPRCDRNFQNLLFLENHMFGHLWPRCKYECSTCASMFILKKQIDAHVERCEEEVKVALRRFASRSAKPVVKSAWTPEERRLGKVCTICTKRVKSSAWTSHMTNHQKVNGELTEQFSCDACDKLFFRKSDVEKHIAQKHRKDGKKMCSKCKKLFSSARELQIHRADCKKVYTKVCPICQNEIDLFQRINHLKAHAEEEVGNSTSNKCPRCDRACSTPECLINHMLNHYEPFREFECDSCLLGFKTRIILEKHKAACSGPEPKNGPAKKRNWNIGVKRKRDDVIQWKCPACLTLFDTEKECSDHISSVHEVEGGEVEDDEVMSVFT